MTFWRPMYAPKKAEPWYLSPRLMGIDMSRLAARLIYAHVNIVPIARPYANDRDHATW